MSERFLREEMMLGAEAMEKLRSAHVAIFGIGGVGSWCAEALARYARAIGIGDDIEPDVDTFPLSGEECAMTHVFLCTDGFSGSLDEDDCMKRINDPAKDV